MNLLQCTQQATVDEKASNHNPEEADVRPLDLGKENDSVNLKTQKQDDYEKSEAAEEKKTDAMVAFSNYIVPSTPIKRINRPVSHHNVVYEYEESKSQNHHNMLMNSS